MICPKPSICREPPLDRRDHQPFARHEDQHDRKAGGKKGCAVGRGLRAQHEVAEPARCAQQFRNQGDLPGDPIGDARCREPIRHQQRQPQPPQHAGPVAGEAPPHFHEIGVGVAQAFRDIDQAERNEDRDLDKDDAEVAGLEPDRREDRPADGRERVEHRLDPLVHDGFEPGYVVGQKCEAAADQERQRDRHQHPPCRCEQVPQKIGRHEQLGEAARNGNRSGEDEFRQFARNRPPRDEREHDQPFADQTFGRHRRHG